MQIVAGHVANSNFAFWNFLGFQIFSSIRVFSSESALPIRWPMYWSFSFNISPSSEHPGLISFRMDCLDLLVVQGTLKSLQHHSSKASILWCSAFEIRLIIFFAAKDGKALYSQQKQDRELTVAQIMNSLLPNSDLN